MNAKIVLVVLGKFYFYFFFNLKINKVFLFPALCLVSLSEAVRTKRMYVMCPPNFIKIGNECYYFSTDQLSWLEAHFECKDKDSRLAEPIKHEDRKVRRYLMRSDNSEF